MGVEVTAGKTVDAVVDWRRRQLVEAGFAEALADRLSCDPRYDLHALIELAERGCTPALAVQILAPFDGSAA
jgi:energy-converting hydrogenase A subunit M